jgi:predicted DCC family thiol-disulfide oxidoreductase YuxK
MSATQAISDTHLPSPEENPTGDIVIYDGQCRFCRASVARLARWDRGRRLSFMSLHDPQVASRFPQLTYEQLMEEMYLIDRRGRIHRGAEAFRHFTTRIPRLFPLAPLLHIPFTLPFWRWAYRQIARRRYQLFGKTAERCDNETCQAHFK